MNHLYCGTAEPEIKSIDVAICRVRKKLALAGVPDLIDTVWGCGYILREPRPMPPCPMPPCPAPFESADMATPRGHALPVAEYEMAD